MFRRIVHILATRPLLGFRPDAGMPYADIPPVRRALIRRTLYGLFCVVDRTPLVVIEDELRRRLP